MNVKKIKNLWYKTNIIVPLRGFCKVYENGSYSDTAKDLGLSQSTITRQIQSIEREIKTELFTKATNGKFEPTKDGEFLYELVKPKIQSFDYIYDYFFSKNDTPSDENTIRLSAHHTFVSNIVPDCINRYKQDNKGDSITKFFLKNSSFTEALNDLDRDNVDLAIYPIGEFPEDRKHSKAKYKINDLFTLKPTIIVHKDNTIANKDDHKITYRDLKKQNMLLIDKDKILSIYGKICQAHNITGNIAFENSDWETIKNFVRLNLGIQFYSNINRIPNLSANDLITKDISHLFPEIKVRLVKKQGKVLSENLRNFIDVIFNISKNFGTPLI